MISFIKSANTVNEFPKCEKEVVFVGRSNVGKSSLFNVLYKKDLAYVGKTPGKTRMINFFNIDDMYLACDVPGYGYANRSQNEAIIFGDMMEAYFKRKSIKLVVMIVDSRIGLTKDDLNMKDFLEEKSLRYLIVANKIDKLSNNELNNNKRKLFNSFKEIYYVSTIKRTNIDILKNAIENIVMK